MGDYINIEGVFDGTVSFEAYDMVGQKDSPLIRVRCKDNESGKTARGDMWCTEKALPYTIKALKALGIEGENDDAILDAAEGLQDAPCTFETEQNGEYFNAIKIRAQGEEFSGGGGGGVEKGSFMAKVFGSASAPSAPVDTDDDPF